MIGMADRTLPAGVTRTELLSCISHLDHVLAPATAEQFAVALDAVFAFQRAYDFPGDQVEIVRLYRKALARYPAWAIEPAFRGAIDAAKFPRFPMISEIEVHVPERYHRLADVRYRLSLAERVGIETVPIGERASEAEVQEILRRATRAIRAPVPDDAPPPGRPRDGPELRALDRDLREFPPIDPALTGPLNSTPGRSRVDKD